MKQHNPNSYKLPRRRDSSNSWSELPQDLLNLVFERFGLADFRRAESVCTSWYSAARQCVGKKQIPWLILLPDTDDMMNNHSCMLFNPEEDKLYKIQHQCVEFAKSYCLATYGNWLFMRDHRYNLYLLNLFTHERINLPPVESQLGTTKLERTTKGWFCISNDHHKRNYIYISIESPVFWIDEHTKEYIVLWGFGEWSCVAYSKKGDKFWNQIQIRVVYGGSQMVYKDHKLYYLQNEGYYFGSSVRFIKIFDFSGDIPQETFQCDGPGNISSLDPTGKLWRFTSTKLVVTVTGDVLIVEKLVRPFTLLWSFRIYKVYSSGVFKNYEQVDSLGDEAMLFDLGITVLANDDIVGFKRNSIYLKTVCHEKNTTQICRFNLETREMEPLHKFDCLSHRQLARARWFLPCFKQRTEKAICVFVKTAIMR